MPKKSDQSPYLANRLLASLPHRSLQALEPHLFAYPLKFGETLYVEHQPQQFFYFPVSGMISLIYLMHDGSTAEIGIVGRDGTIGMAALVEGARTTSRSLVQGSGLAYRISAPAVRELAASDSHFADMLLRYTQIVWTQVSQTAVCNRHHAVPEQVARWLLHSVDLVDGNTIEMTQDLMAEMLGVGREGINRAARAMKQAGFIDYARGKLTILNRSKVEALACECYSVIVKEVERLLPRSPLRALEHRSSALCRHEAQGLLADVTAFLGARTAE